MFSKVHVYSQYVKYGGCIKTRDNFKIAAEITPAIFRSYAAVPKRFYKNINIIQNDGYYEIVLDQKKLKTPTGNVVRIKNQALTLAVAVEWDSQKDRIETHNMFLTSLVCGVIDNCNKITKSDLIRNSLNYLDTDTILFHSKDNIDLYNLQLKEWQPIIKWFNDEFHVNIQPTINLSVPIIDSEEKNEIQRYLNSFDFSTIYGVAYVIECLKSIILSTACIKRFIVVHKAVSLSRLEEEFQSDKWGVVEWAHDMNRLDLQSRVSAAILFIHLNLSEEMLVKKMK